MSEENKSDEAKALRLLNTCQCAQGGAKPCKWHTVCEDTKKAWMSALDEARTIVAEEIREKLAGVRQYGIGSVTGAVPMVGGGFVRMDDIMIVIDKTLPEVTIELCGAGGTVRAENIGDSKGFDRAEGVSACLRRREGEQAACDEYRKHNEVLEEALERVRIERDANRTKLDNVTDELRAAQGKLAEVVKIVKEHVAWTWTGQAGTWQCNQCFTVPGSGHTGACPACGNDKWFLVTPHDNETIRLRSELAGVHNELSDARNTVTRVARQRDELRTECGELTEVNRKLAAFARADAR